MASGPLKFSVPGPGTPGSTSPRASWPWTAHSQAILTSSETWPMQTCPALVRSWPDCKEGVGPPRGTGTVSMKPCPSDAK